MPRYPHLLTNPFDTALVPAQAARAAQGRRALHGRRNRDRAGSIEAQAKAIAADVEAQQGPTGLADKEIVALTAYLQRLGTDIRWKRPSRRRLHRRAPPRPPRRRRGGTSEVGMLQELAARDRRDGLGHRVDGVLSRRSTSWSRCGRSGRAPRTWRPTPACALDPRRRDRSADDVRDGHAGLTRGRPWPSTKTRFCTNWTASRSTTTRCRAGSWPSGGGR